jgi:two-component system nitrogen regulation sensor histidine kinase NtrY
MGEIRHVIRAVEHSGGVALEREIKISFPNKTLILLVSATALKDESGKWVGLVLVFEDLTQVQKAQRAAAWREVARRIAHEIKNPLTPIQLSAQRLRKRYLDKFSSDGKVFDECTRTIVSQVEELKGLVNEFSNFARMPASNPVPNNLSEIIEDALLLFREGHKDVTFDFQEKNPVPVFNLDRDQMKRVMINLLDNAVDSMEDKGSVAVETSYDEHLKMVRIEVADNGRGISPEEKSRLFEPYFSTKKSGMGLGLAIANTIVSDHNGYIRVKDNHPKGTRFVVELPVQL